MKVFNYVTAVACAVLASAACAIDDECATPLTEAQLADHWVASDGVKSDKDSAIDEALKRAVSMVYGELMSGEKNLKTHSAEMSVSGPDGDAKLKRKSTTLDTTTTTKTAGFVREYKVISVVPVKDGVKAHVHARIISPRAGVDAVILVTRPEASVELKSELIKVGPKKTISGREIAGVTEDALCGALAGSSKFRVCTAKDMKKAIANNNLTTALVGAGMVPSSELLQAGQMLTCDYILSTHLDKISYSSKLGQNKVTKKFGQVKSMKIVLSFRLTNVRTGTAAANDTLTLTLDNEAIDEMLAADEKADLLKGTLAGIVEPLQDWIKENSK